MRVELRVPALRYVQVGKVALPPRLLTIYQILLLRSYYTPGPYYPKPRDGGPARESVVSHHVKGNKSPCSPQTSLAVDSYEALFLVADVEKRLDNLGGGEGAVVKVEVVKVEAALLKRALVVGVGLVEPHYCCNVEVMEHMNILIGLKGEEAWSNLLLAGRGSLERHKLWVDDVEVAVEGVVPVLILLKTEGLELKPASVYCALEALETVENVESEGRLAICGIPETHPGIRIQALERSVRLLSTQAVAKHHVASKQEGCVCPHRWILLCVVNNCAVPETRVCILSVDKVAESMDDAEVDGAKVGTEVLISFLEIRRKEEELRVLLNCLHCFQVGSVACQAKPLALHELVYSTNIELCQHLIFHLSVCSRTARSPFLHPHPPVRVRMSGGLLQRTPPSSPGGWGWPIVGRVPIPLELPVPPSRLSCSRLVTSRAPIAFIL
mmetsp:Transcript_31788/g.73952  ORF Transcript_31788/g.73952 Transcript_31788/m.73952 type:complete len:440 (+) Transcript_31788:294-1613(+)